MFAFRCCCLQDSVVRAALGRGTARALRTLVAVSMPSCRTASAPRARALQQPPASWRSRGLLTRPLSSGRSLATAAIAPVSGCEIRHAIRPAPMKKQVQRGQAGHRTGLPCRAAQTEDLGVIPPAAEQCFYEWMPGKQVAYRILKHGGEGQPPLVLLTGFGVGSFHYNRLLEELKGDRRDVYLLDFFGQGNSWPTVDPCPLPEPSTEPGFQHGFGSGAVAPEFLGFRYSADMWTDQVKFFLENIVQRKALLCGNSLGGFISVNLASLHPELVEGLVLLNATPFWGTTALKFWDGTYPVPQPLSMVGTQWWNGIRDPATIRTLLDFVYAKKYDQGGYDDRLVEQILEPTRQPAAASVFCSILSSPPPERSFDHMLEEVRQAGIPCMLAYGREDPWVIPLWGLRASRQLGAKAHYYELTPAGHCPQDEAPVAVACVIDAFANYISGQRETMPGSMELAGIEVVYHETPKARTPVEMLDGFIHKIKTKVLKQPF